MHLQTHTRIKDDHLPECIKVQDNQIDNIFLSYEIHGQTLHILMPSSSYHIII